MSKAAKSTLMTQAIVIPKENFTQLDIHAVLYSHACDHLSMTVSSDGMSYQGPRWAHFPGLIRGRA